MDVYNFLMEAPPSGASGEMCPISPFDQINNIDPQTLHMVDRSLGGIVVRFIGGTDLRATSGSDEKLTD